MTLFFAHEKTQQRYLSSSVVYLFSTVALKLHYLSLFLWRPCSFFGQFFFLDLNFLKYLKIDCLGKDMTYFGWNNNLTWYTFTRKIDWNYCFWCVNISGITKTARNFFCQYKFCKSLCYCRTLTSCLENKCV